MISSLGSMSLRRPGRVLEIDLLTFMQDAEYRRFGSSAEHEGPDYHVCAASRWKVTVALLTLQ